MSPPRSSSSHRPPSVLESRVVITGIGLVTGLNGLDLGPGRTGRARTFREETWDALRAGRCAVRILDWPRAEGEPPYRGCPLPMAPGPDHDRLPDLLSAAVDEAVEDAALGLDPPPFDRDRAAALIGLSKGGMRSMALAHRLIDAGRREDAAVGRLWEQAWPSCGASLVARRYGLRGPSLGPVAACATGLVAALQGADLIRRGTCDLALVGSVDASLEPLLLGAFRRMRVLAREDDDPAQAIRPWDRRRSGFLVGEGGAILVLEREDHARARGIVPYAELAGGALGADAYHGTDLDPDPTGLADVIRRALDAAAVAPSEIDHVNVHGTATRANDPVECRALRRALGAQADRVACSANKSQIGHLLGAAGAAELAITCLALRDGFVPPTLNLDEPDPACDLDGTPHVGRALPIRAALKLSIGFGGHLAAAVLRRSAEGPWRGRDG